MSKENKPWIEKYRPTDSQSVLGNHSFLLSLTKQSIPHCIFHGESGTGKTSMAKAICSEIAHKYIEVNASDYNGIDTIRNTIQNFCTVKSSGLKVIILDECDWLSYDAQKALRNLIERHSKTTRFILLCNMTQRLISGLMSRCMRFTFPSLSYEDCRNMLYMISENESFSLDDNAVEVLYWRTNGDLRQMITILEHHYPDVDTESLLKGTGIPTKEQIHWFLESPRKERLNELIDKKGVNIVPLVQYISQFIQSNKPRVISHLAQIERYSKAGCQEQILRHYLCSILQPSTSKKR